jgi:hypothetical protein
MGEKVFHDYESAVSMRSIRLHLKANARHPDETRARGPPR